MKKKKKTDSYKACDWPLSAKRRKGEKAKRKGETAKKSSRPKEWKWELRQAANACCAKQIPPYEEKSYELLYFFWSNTDRSTEIFSDRDSHRSISRRPTKMVVWELGQCRNLYEKGFKFNPRTIFPENSTYRWEIKFRVLLWNWLGKSIVLLNENPIGGNLKSYC